MAPLPVGGYRSRAPLPSLLRVFLGTSRRPTPLWMLSTPHTIYASRCQPGKVPLYPATSNAGLRGSGSRRFNLHGDRAQKQYVHVLPLSSSHSVRTTKHAAGVCLGTIQNRTHVQLALACQQSMLKVQHRLRFTMQHVYGHTGNLGDECADHAAALGTFGHGIKSYLSTRWVRHNFDTSACSGSCNNIGDVLENT